MYTKFYQHRRGFVEHMTKHFGVFLGSQCIITNRQNHVTLKCVLRGMCDEIKLICLIREIRGEVHDAITVDRVQEIRRRLFRPLF